MTPRSLRAWINQNEVGTLSDQARIWCFQYAPATRPRDRWQLQTACDKVAWPDQAQLAWPILGVDRFCRVSKGLRLDAAGQMGIGKSTAERIMGALCAKTWEQAQVLYEAVESDNAALSQARAELSATLAGEGRSLRAIIHVVINEMTQLLR
jgi:serine/threonine-protein kinase HipA